MMRDKSKARRLWIAAATTLALLTGATGALVKRQFAQEEKVRDVHSLTTSPPDQNAGPGHRFDADGLEFERKLVRGAPFSATLLIETTPSSADTPTTATSLIYRDAKGRTRRDRMPNLSNTEPQITTINDPVAGFTYALEHPTHLFRRTVFQALRDDSDRKTKTRTGVGDPEQARSSQMLPLPAAWGSGQSLKSGVASSFSETRTEQLGEREIEGVIAEGTRITVTLPAGAVDNSEPIAIVNERWYSPELKTAMLIKRSDPRQGETVYRLTNVKQNEPAATLFVVPKDYKISDRAAKDLLSPY